MREPSAQRRGLLLYASQLHDWDSRTNRTHYGWCLSDGSPLSRSRDAMPARAGATGPAALGGVARRALQQSGMPAGNRKGGNDVTHRFPALLAAPAPARERIWLTGARLFDGTGAALRENTAILVEDGIIRRVADDRERCPDGARPVDVGRRVLMPGLTDAHTHASGRVPHTAKGAEEALPGLAAHFLQAELRDYLRFGVTTIRVCGSQGLMPQQARQAMRYGAFRGPRLLTCGKIISATAPGGRFYGDMYREADGQDDIRRAVREQIRSGADFVKVMTTGARSNELEDPEPLQLTEPELAAVTDEAHRLGYRVAAHAEGLDGCAAAIRHGADTIEHGMYLHQRPDLLEAMAAGGQVLVPTLSGYYWMAGLEEAVGPGGGPGPSTDPASTSADPASTSAGPARGQAGPARPHADPGMPPMLIRLARHNLEQGAASMRAARQAGVPIALGSDVSLATGLEIQRMVHHGLTAAEALVAATRTAAEALGLGEHVGTVAEGKLADLVVVDGDPLTEPHLLCDSGRIWLVLQLGVPVAGQALTSSVLTSPEPTSPAPTSRSS
jgi:imidazolonepropionase-like amidohydrolase